MLFQRQAHQVPQAVRILGIILCWPDVVNSLRGNVFSIAGKLSASVPVSSQRLLSQPAPAFVFSRIVKAHRQKEKPEPPCKGEGSGSMAQAQIISCQAKQKARATNPRWGLWLRLNGSGSQFAQAKSACTSCKTKESLSGWCCPGCAAASWHRRSGTRPVLLLLVL